MPARAAALVATLCLAALRAQAPAPAPTHHVDRAQLMRDVVALSAPGMEGRAAGTRGGMRARQWIEERFRVTGLMPAGAAGYIQPFTFGRSPTRAANVVGRVAGRDPSVPIVVVTAHYDHFGIRRSVLYPGADDNASGVAALLAAARHFVANAPRRTFVFAALDAEEAGLHGARALVRSNLLPRGRVALNINIDMASRSDRNEIYAAGTYHSPWQRPILADVQMRSAVTIRFGHDRPAARAGGRDDWTPLSDHAAFHAAGIPFLYFGVEDHPDYHEPTDTVDRIDPRFFGDVADMLVEAMSTFDRLLGAR